MGGKHLHKSKSDPGRARLHHSKQRSRSGKGRNHHQLGSNRISKPKLSENLSFCGCGFLGIYHVGVASCFHEYAPQLSMHKIAGSSAGALVAAAHICGNLQLAYATTDILSVAIDARARTLGPFHPSFDINAIVRDALEKGLPEDVHHRASGKLHISLTRVYDGENVIVSKFDSKEDVIQALICSCFIPFWSGLVAPKYKGVTYIDGGFSNNLLILDDKTVTVSPFAGEADICPQDDVYNLLSISLSNTSISITPHNLYRLSHALLPPPPEVLSDLCEQGFADGIRFLQRMKLISCDKCLEIQSSLLLTTTSSDSDLINRATSSFAYHGQQTTTTAAATNNSDHYDRHESTSKTINYESQAIFDANTIFEDEYEDEFCDGCDLRRRNALRDALPKLFTDRIREACDNVNKSLYNWFYSHRPIKYLSYLAAPYYLPMNISLALFMKCWQQLPFIGTEMMKCMHELRSFLCEIAKRVNDKSTTSILMEPSLLWREDEDKNEKSSESSISVKITADCRRSSQRSLTTYECCLTIALFGSDINSAPAPAATGKSA